jgi:hypothetical protein
MLAYGKLPDDRQTLPVCWSLNLLASFGFLALLCVPARADPASDAVGKYSGVACQRRDVSCVPARASDRLRIFRAPDRGLRLHVLIAFEHGQRCELEADLIFSDGHLMARTEGLDPNAACELILHPRYASIVLEDIGQRCREVYCGARGTLDGVRFKRR